MDIFSLLVGILIGNSVGILVMALMRAARSDDEAAS
jgi:hypothetical protein